MKANTDELIGMLDMVTYEMEAGFDKVTCEMKASTDELIGELRSDLCDKIRDEDKNEDSTSTRRESRNPGFGSGTFDAQDEYET